MLHAFLQKSFNRFFDKFGVVNDVFRLDTFFSLRPISRYMVAEQLLIIHFYNYYLYICPHSKFKNIFNVFLCSVENIK